MQISILPTFAHLNGGGRLELELTLAKVISINFSVVVEDETSLRTIFLIFLCGNDLITRTGIVNVSESVMFCNYMFLLLVLGLHFNFT